MLSIIASLRDRAGDRQPVARKTPEGKLSREHVFVTGANTPWRNNLLRAFYTVCRRAGIKGAEPNGSVDIHSLRVTFTTLALEHGARPKAVQDILGHSTLSLTMGIYAKATEQSKREAVSVLPFASSSSPEHIIPMQSAHTVSTSISKVAETPSA